MKIAILSCFYPYRGGLSQFNATLYQELERQGHEVRAFNFKRQYPDILFPGKTQYVTEDDNAVRIPSTRLLDTVNPFSYISTYRTIRDWKPDALIVRYWMSWFAPSLGFICRKLKKRGVRTLAVVDNVLPHERHFFDAPLTKYFLSGAQACVTLCRAVGEELLGLCPSMEVKVFPHPIYSNFGERIPRDEALEALGLDPARKTLLFFGLIRKYKGLDILLEAFRTLSDEYQLIVAGEPYGSFDEYRAIIDSLPNRDNIAIVTEFIKDSDVSRYFSGADLCVLPYRSATQSGVSATAYHFEVPMLVTDVGGLREMISDTGTGLLAEECSPESVRAQILHYFSTPAIKEGCIEAIRRRREELSWSKFAGDVAVFAEKKQQI